MKILISYPYQLERKKKEIIITVITELLIVSLRICCEHSGVPLDCERDFALHFWKVGSIGKCLVRVPSARLPACSER